MIGLHINEKKTEYMAYKHGEVEIKSIIGTILKAVTDCKYLGSWIDTSLKDMNIRMQIAWSAASKLETIWQSHLERKLTFLKVPLKASFYMGQKAANQIHGNGDYTRLFRKALNVLWSDRPTTYGQFPPIIEIVKERRLRFLGHVWRRDEQTLHGLLLWEPQHGKRSRGRPTTSCRPNMFWRQLDQRRTEASNGG